MNNPKYRKILIVAAISASLSGCAKDGSLATWGKCALVGGGTGGILGAIDSTAAAGWGALGGAAIGGILCALKDDDSDNDGVYDSDDACPDTPEGVNVDARGCPVDSDDDGVPDYLDKCPDTRAGMPVNAEGCPDSDGDGVADNLDRCPGTLKGAVVDSFGCSIDSDGDGIPDGIDQCPDTPANVPVDEKGCPLNSDAGVIFFDFDKDALTAESRQQLDEVVALAKREPNTRFKVTGYTDDKGKPAYNKKLSMRRAVAAMKYLKSQGVEEGRIDLEGAGAILHGNNTSQGRHDNRKVVITTLR